MKYTSHLLTDDGQVPNHPSLPVLVYPQALRLSGADPASMAEETFTRNGWGGLWRNGIYDFHHYHSTAHEVLAIVQGEARVQLGGEGGVTLSVSAGDVLILPAGTGHKRLSASRGLLVVGAYPPGRQWDLCRGMPGERPQVLDNIQATPLPETDPIFGGNGPLVECWLGGGRPSLESSL
jgi:uncharacterized protein YjlB